MRKFLLSSNFHYLTLVLGWATCGVMFMLTANNIVAYMAVGALSFSTLIYFVLGVENGGPIDDMQELHTSPRMKKEDVRFLVMHPEKLVELLELALAHNKLRVVVEERVGCVHSGGLPGNELNIKTFKIRKTSK